MPGVKRKEPKRDGTPMARPPGILPCGCAGGFRIFSTAPPCAGEKLARIRASHPADFPPPARRAIGAPGKAARSQRAEATARATARASPSPRPSPPSGAWGRGSWCGARFGFALPAGEGAAGSCGFARACALASGAHDARPLFRGPSAAVRRGRGGRAAGEPTDGLAFSTGQESDRKARPRLTDLPGRTPGKRRRGVSFLFGDFLFGQAKRKSLGPRQRHETALSLAAAARNRSVPCSSGMKPLCRWRKRSSDRWGRPPTGDQTRSAASPSLLGRTSADHFSTRSNRRMKSRTCG